MAEKEFLLGNKARELLIFTKRATRVVSDDISQKDVRVLFRRIAELDDIRDVKTVCAEVDQRLSSTDRVGFTKSTFRLYGEDMRMIAKDIVRGIHAANNKYFPTEYEERLACIDDVLDNCSLLLEYILICVEEHIISVSRAGTWTKKVTDVKNMAGRWKKNDGGRAQKLRDEAKIKEDKHQIELTKAAIQQVKEEGQRKKEESTAMHPPPPGAVR